MAGWLLPNLSRFYTAVRSDMLEESVEIPLCKHVLIPFERPWIPWSWFSVLRLLPSLMSSREKRELSKEYHRISRDIGKEDLNSCCSLFILYVIIIFRTRSYTKRRYSLNVSYSIL